MPTFRNRDTGEIVQAVQLKRPLESARGLPVKDIENTAWAGDWFVVGPNDQGWLSAKDFLAAHQPVLQDPPFGAVVFDPTDGELMGEVHLVEFDANNGKMTVAFTTNGILSKPG